MHQSRPRGGARGSASRGRACLGEASFELAVREALAERDRQRLSRLMDMVNYEAADSAFVGRVMRLAGFAEPESAARAVRKNRRAQRLNEPAAFGDDLEAS